jgi:hypothetical protein
MNSRTASIASILAAFIDLHAPSADELDEFEARCRTVDLPELGHLLYTAPTDHHAKIAARVATDRIADAAGVR